MKILATHIKMEYGETFKFKMSKSFRKDNKLKKQIAYGVLTKTEQIILLFEENEYMTLFLDEFNEILSEDRIRLIT